MVENNSVAGIANNAQLAGSVRIAPTRESERIVSIDVLRGFALLGILMMNIQSFGFVDALYLNPTAAGPNSGSDYWCWWFAHLFFDLKFMTLFSALFGAGIVMMWQRADSVGKKVTGFHYRRMAWLLLIGLAHAHLLWHGDILVPYAMCGMVMYWMCGLKPSRLIPIGLCLISVGSIISLLMGFAMSFAGEEMMAEMNAEWVMTPEMIAENLAIYRGSWLEQLPDRSLAALMMETFLFALVFFWRIGGLMLVGMGLYKLGFFSAACSNRFYSIGAVLGFAIGLTTVLFGVQQNEAHNWSVEYSFMIGSQYNYWGSMFVSSGYACVVMLMCKLGWLDGLRKSLAAVGQMALTNYLLQTIICTTIFYGHGFGWFGYVSWLNMLWIVAGVWLFQLIVSPIWLKHFRFGPFEWLWRSLSYWKAQPIWK